MLVLKDRLLVKFDMRSELTPSGLIIIPSEVRDPAYTGVVLAIGPQQLTVRVGDRVVFSRYAGVPLPMRYFDDEAHTYSQERSLYAIVDSGEILAIIDDDPTPCVERTTVVVAGSWLLQQIAEQGKLIYVNYEHTTDSLYITTEA